MEQVSPAELALQYINYTANPVFLTGKAGTGKTTFLKALHAATHKRMVVVAPTGIAAINAGGVTIHSLFQLPFGTYLPKAPEASSGQGHQAYHTPRSIVKYLNMNAAKRKVITDMELLVIDEVSMLRADLLDAIDMVLRYVRRNNAAAFGGVQMLFIGDLLQLPPVVKSAEWGLMAQFYKSAYFFDAQVLQSQSLVYIELDKIYRQADAVFISLLNNLRNNRVTPEDTALLKTFYREDFRPAGEEKYITLTTHNNRADALNKQKLDELAGVSYLYRATIENEFSESAHPAESILELKAGAQVMFIKNDPTGEQRFFNGKIAVVTALSSDRIEVQAEDSRHPIVLEKYKWENIRYTADQSTGEIKEELIGTFTQYPLRLAWAITVHKSQGLTFDKAIVDVGSAFAPGQVYVALSRLRSLNGLVLTSLVSGAGLRQDQHVHLFSSTKPQTDVLALRVKQDRQVFLCEFLMQSFQLGPLDNYVYEHVHSYTKDINRSAKQKHAKWADKLLKQLTELRGQADKFMGQIRRLSADDTMEGMQALLDRVMAAENYFSPRIEAFSEDIFARMELVKQDKQVLEFLNELLEMEALFYAQLKKIKKAVAFLSSVIGKKDFRREDVERLFDAQARSKRMEKVFAMGDALSFTDKKASKPRKKKPAKKK